MNAKKVLFIDSTHPVLYEELETMGFVCEQFPEAGREALEKIAGNYSGIIIRSKIKLDSDFLQHAKQLKFIGRVGAGMENIDVDYAKKCGIHCLNAPEGNRNAVGEQAVAMLLALFNNLLKVDAEVRRGIWLREENRGIELGGKTVGIIGYGNTGSAFALKLRGFDVKILAYDKYKSNFGNDFVEETNLNKLFCETDILSLHVPLSNETTHMIDNKFLQKFQKNIFIINTSRGKVVKTDDLVRALQTRKVRGACLDVLEYEGLSFEKISSCQRPATFQKLVSMPNVILSPHIAGWTHESLYNLAITLVEKIKKLAV